MTPLLPDEIVVQFVPSEEYMTTKLEPLETATNLRKVGDHATEDQFAFGIWFDPDHTKPSVDFMKKGVVGETATNNFNSGDHVIELQFDGIKKPPMPYVSIFQSVPLYE
jgi:hypothetical protein